MITVVIHKAVESDFERMDFCVSERRKEKIDRLKRCDDKLLSLAAELCVSAAARLCGLGASPVNYGYYSSGAPYLLGTNKHISVSHSGKFAVCSVGDVVHGTDIETESSKNQARLAEFLGTAEGVDPVLDWCARESFVKMLTTGIEDIRKVRFDGCRCCFTETGRGAHIKSFDIEGGKLCVACPTDEDIELLYI
ncbi:MAG: hypothetical protein IJY56_03630 [Clostridia bacterium]|nr:hypothetical protein [Clostridia bacterium]